MEHAKSSKVSPDQQKHFEQPAAQLPSEKVLAQTPDLHSTVEVPTISKTQDATKPETTVTISKRTMSSLSSTENKIASVDSELGSRLECLSSNLAGIPLPDVTDPTFDVRQWATKLLQGADEDKVKFRKASFVFKGLDVNGSAAGATVQPTVASAFKAPLALARRLCGRKPPQTKILNSFDGVVNSGEMLLVLGRPGSGCSTLLRTIVGKLGGIEVGAQSTINYNGTACPFHYQSQC